MTDTNYGYPIGDLFSGDKVNGDKVGGDKHVNLNMQGKFYFLENKSGPHSVFIDIDTIRTPFTALEDIHKNEPPFAAKILLPVYAQALQRRVVVVQVPPDVPGRLLLAEAARALHQELLKLEPDQTPPELREYNFLDEEIHGNIVLGRAEVELNSLSAPTILLFTRAERHQLGWDLDQLSRTALQGRHYVLAVTSSASTRWLLQESEQRYWIKQNTVFRPEYLTSLLRQRLSEEQINLPRAMQDQTAANSVLIKTSDKLFTVRDTAIHLQKPFNIQSWIQAVIRAGKSTAPQELLMLMHENARQDLNQALSRWFHKSLKPHEQLLAIALCLLDGLEKRQLLAALQEIRRSVWMQLGDAGGIIDHTHLLPLDDFFTLRRLNDTLVRVESVTDGQHDMLLRLTFEHYGMHLEELLPWFAEQVIQSSASGASSSRLFETPVYREEFRRVASNAFKGLGLHAPKLVLPSFVKLLANNLEGAHACLARTLSFLVVQERDKYYVSQLSQWQWDLQFHTHIGKILKPPTNNEPATIINDVIVMTVGYILRDLQLGQVPDEIIALFTHAVQDSNELVRQHVVKYTFKHIPRHVRQLDPVLRILVQQEELRIQIVDMVAQLYLKDTQTVELLMNTWLAEAQREREHDSSGDYAGAIESLLITVAQILYKLEHSNAGQLKFEEVYQKLLSVLQTAQQPYAREQIWNVCINVAQGNIVALAGFLTCTYDSEVPKISRRLLELDRSQRGLIGSGATAPTGQRVIEVTSVVTGVTTVQSALLALLLTTHDAIVRKLSIYTLGEIAKYLQPELSSQQDAVHHSFYQNKLAPHLVLREEREEVKQATQELLPIVRLLNTRHPKAARLLLSWLSQEQGTFIGDVKRCLTAIINYDESLDWHQLVQPHIVIHSLWKLWLGGEMPDGIARRYGLLVIQTLAGLVIVLGGLLVRNEIIIIVGICIFGLLCYRLYQEIMRPQEI